MTHHHHEPADFWTREHPEPVVLDIGGDVGALVLYTPPAMHGQEIEISPLGDDGHRTHTAVLLRSVGGQRMHAAVYAELAAGTYQLWPADPTLPRQVAVAAGQVAELDWR